MRNFLILLFIALIGHVATAQVISNSPYSSYGIGELGGMDHPAFIGVGNANIAFIDSVNLNFYNPASYSRLSKGQPLFSLGVSSRISNFSEGNESYTSTLNSVQHFAFGLSFKNRFGMAFGLKPFSRTGYSFTNSVAVDSDSLKYTYSGTGGINEVFGGLSADIIHRDSTKWGVGANLGYLFGASTNTRSSVLINTSSVTGGVETRDVRARSFHYEFGTYFEHKFSKEHSLLLSATYTPKQELNAFFDNGRYYANNIELPSGYDTLFQISDSAGKITAVPIMALGFKYTWNRSRKDVKSTRLNSQVDILASYTMENWEDFRLPFDTLGTTYLNSTKISFGVQYIPETEFINNKSLTKYYERIRYRAGFYTNTLPYQTNGMQVTDFGTTFGLGLPIAIQGSVSSINLGFATGKRGISDGQSLSERYYGINLGISIAPGGDRWFVKRKLN